jgi:hypothetical protein
MAVQLCFAAAGHSRVCEVILAGRTGYWLCDPDRVLAHGVVKLYVRHPDDGDFDLNDNVVGPWVATLKVTGAARVQWLDRTRTIIAFDPATLTTEYISTVPTFNASGVYYDPEPIA